MKTPKQAQMTLKEYIDTSAVLARARFYCYEETGRRLLWRAQLHVNRVYLDSKR